MALINGLLTITKFEKYVHTIIQNIYIIHNTIARMEADQIIELLNQKGVEIPTKKKKEGSQKTQKQCQQEVEIDLNGLSIDQMENFNDLYTQRMQKMQKKNQIKQEELKKKQQIKDKIQKAFPDSKNIIAVSQNPKLPTIRYLVFKNWSGSHLNYQLADNGYKFRFTNGVAALIKHLLQENGFCQATNNEGLIIWNIGVIQSNVYAALGAYQKINHFPKSFQITRKDLMLQNLSKMKHKHPQHYNFYPQTYILPAQGSIFMQHAQKQKQEKWYIIKPSNKSQGKGIWISNRPEQILAKQKDCVVVSEYVHNPLLVNGLKFDMRIYVAITCFNPLRIYIYQDGLTRFATSQYSSDLNSKQNMFAHLTNYSLNKFSENFVANQDEDECKGHKWSLHALKQYMGRQLGYDVAAIWSRIEDLIIKSIISIENTVFNAMEMTVPYRTNCFQVLGFDVLLDDMLRPWLLQINLSPSLNTDSPLDLKIKGSMIADLFTMMGVVSLQQQFAEDKSYILNGNKMSAKQMKNQYAKLQRLVIKESEEQAKRSGGWKRIFPTETASRYKPFFDVDRPLNRLLRDEQLKKFKQNNMHLNMNQVMKTISENPQIQKKKGQ